MNTKPHLILTSIFEPTKSVNELADGCFKNEWDFTVIGDKKSPPFEVDGAKFLSIKDQESLEFTYPRLCPYNHYVRKNIGYLVAIRDGAEIIVETDDDNSPNESFWNERSINLKACSIRHDGWVNAYSYFSDSDIWPRGFPLEELENARTSRPLTTENTMVRSPIQQGLADLNPDIDAIFRLTRELPVSFNKRTTPIALKENAWCPFNSQNTTWFPEAYPLLYLPANCSFRMTDIWRSFIANAILLPTENCVTFHNATVYQDRNQHNLLNDFQQEIDGYLKNNIIRKILTNLSLAGKTPNIPDDMRRCYEALVQGGIFPKEELTLLNAWLQDLDQC